jgi:hypothetical protein
MLQPLNQSKARQVSACQIRQERRPTRGGTARAGG